MTTSNKVKKPFQLRIIFLLNAIMMILPFIFYYVFTTKNISIDGLDPIIMIYTGIGYIISFIVLVASILKRNLILFRIIFIINILIAIPAQAYIGVVVAIISILISLNRKVKTYFASTGEIGF